MKRIRVNRETLRRIAHNKSRVGVVLGLVAPGCIMAVARVPLIAVCPMTASGISTFVVIQQRKRRNLVRSPVRPAP